MDSEFEYKSSRQLDLIQSFEKIEKPARIYILIDLANSGVLALRPNCASLRFVPEVFPDTKLRGVRTSLNENDIASKFYHFNRTNRIFTEFSNDLVTDQFRSNKSRAQYVLWAFERLQIWVEKSRALFLPGHILDPLVFSQIELEMAMTALGRKNSFGYIASYAETHGLDYEGALEELNLSMSSMKKSLQKTQQLFWRFKKIINDNPPSTLQDLNQLKIQMRAEFCLEYRI